MISFRSVILAFFVGLNVVVLSAQPPESETNPTGVISLAPAAAGPVPADRYARSDLPVVYLSQNWSPAESVEFYGLRQGSPILRKDFFDALEQPSGTDLFRDSAYMGSFGFLPQRRYAANPDGYPVGFNGGAALEVSCAACHTSRLRHGGREYRIDASQAMTDVESWLTELTKAIKLTLQDAPSREALEALPGNSRLQLDLNTKFGRFAQRLLQTPTPRVSQVYVVVRLLSETYARRQRYNDYNDYGQRFTTDAARDGATKHEAYGHGRLDALGAILNQACAEALHTDSNASPANGPVNYPAIWDAPQHTNVQWNGAVDNTATFGPLGRNTGQVLGVFGLVDVQGDAIVGYDSSVRFNALDRAEELVTKVWSPLWPDSFGKDATLAATGRAIYGLRCADCHAIMKRDDPNRQPRDVLIPISEPWGGYPPLGTDPLTAKNWNDRLSHVGPLAGRFLDSPLGKRFPNDPNAQVPSRDVLSHLVVRVIARSFIPWREELTLDSPQRAMLLAPAPPSTTVLMRYKSRPLNGVWSTSPYLHNGSVLNMTELLKAPAERKAKFRVGTVDYDPQNLGYVDAGPFEFDTSKPGNSNSGHTYGVDLSPADKLALIEFLKEL